LDFNTGSSRINLPFWSGKKNWEVTYRKLPEFPVKAIHTGQKSSDENLWEAYIEVQYGVSNLMQNTITY